jgi:hypothetical protein
MVPCVEPRQSSLVKNVTTTLLSTTSATSIQNYIVRDEGEYMLSVTDRAGNSVRYYFVIAPYRPLAVYLQFDTTSKRQLLDGTTVNEPFVVDVPATVPLSKVAITRNGQPLAPLAARSTTYDQDGVYLITTTDASAFRLQVAVYTDAPDVTVRTMDTPTPLVLLPQTPYQVWRSRRTDDRQRSGSAPPTRHVRRRRRPDADVVVAPPRARESPRAEQQVLRAIATVRDDVANQVVYTLATNPVFGYLQVKDKTSGSLVRPTQASTLTGVLLQVLVLPPSSSSSSSSLTYQIATTTRRFRSRPWERSNSPQHCSATRRAPPPPHTHTHTHTLTVTGPTGSFTFPPLVFAPSGPPSIVVSSEVQSVLYPPYDAAERQRFVVADVANPISISPSSSPSSSSSPPRPHFPRWWSPPCPS